MHNLLNFLLRNSHWFFFILLEVISFYFVFSENSYQRSVFLNSSNEVSGKVYAFTSGVSSYFGLKQENESLLKHNGDLQNKIKFLENQIFEITKDSLRTAAYLDEQFEYENEYIPARVINNSVGKLKNFIVINKGTNHGVEKGMGVISQQGIVGEVRAVSENFSVIQSLLNIDSKFSSKLLNTNAFGPIEWLEIDPRFATMREYPAHERVEIGDTVVTSGYSDVFPRGVLIGKVYAYEKVDGMNQYKLKIELSTDFSTLENVLVVKRNYLEEKKNLEKTVIDNVQSK